MSAPNYKSITDALSDALDKLREKADKVKAVQEALNVAQVEYAKAQSVATEVHKTLQGHLADILPEPNRRP